MQRQITGPWGCLRGFMWAKNAPNVMWRQGGSGEKAWPRPCDRPVPLTPASRLLGGSPMPGGSNLVLDTPEARTSPSLRSTEEPWQPWGGHSWPAGRQQPRRRGRADPGHALVPWGPLGGSAGAWRPRKQVRAWPRNSSSGRRSHACACPAPPPARARARAAAARGSPCSSSSSSSSNRSGRQPGPGSCAEPVAADHSQHAAPTCGRSDRHVSPPGLAARAPRQQRSPAIRQP